MNQSHRLRLYDLLKNGCHAVFCRFSQTGGRRPELA